MKYIPSKEQFIKWVLPNKSSYIGCVLTILFGLLAIAFFGYQSIHGSKFEKHVDKRFDKIEELLSGHVSIETQEPQKWISIDISSLVPPTADAVFLIFESKNGFVKGYVRGKGSKEEYYFDSTLNNVTPLSVKISSQTIECRITSYSSPNQNYKISVAGYRDKLE